MAVNFYLEIEFSGLCLFERQKDDSGMRVFLPDARFDRRRTFKHADGQGAIPHVAYVRFNMANLPGVGDRLDSTVTDRGPSFEVVHRLDREMISFGALPVAGKPSVAVDSKGLDVPSFTDFANDLKVEATVRRTRSVPGSEVSNKLVARTDLSGGTIESFSIAGQTWSMGTEPVAGPVADAKEYGGMVVWTSPMLHGNKLTLTLASFDSDKVTTIDLVPQPVKHGTPRIGIKIANLCEKNPLEWDELPQRLVAEPDVDFKWLYTLLTPEVSELPHPQPVSTRTEGELQDCLPGVIGEG